jgi:hypothetical protein
MHSSQPIESMTSSAAAQQPERPFRIWDASPRVALNGLFVIALFYTVYSPRLCSSRSRLPCC